MTSSGGLLLTWAREQQQLRRPGLSMSALGGCRRKAGYLLAQTEPTDDSVSMQSALGSALHEKVAAVAERLHPSDLIEHRVTFAGITGTIDRYDAEAQELVDTKTTSARYLETVKTRGISTEWTYQTAGYAAALIKAKHPVRTIRIDVIARDTGEEWQHRRPFDPAEVAEALVWFRNVRDAELTMLPRDHEPDGPFCATCPFRTACWGSALPGRDPRTALYVDDPDAAKWAEKLRQARDDKKDAERREVEAKGALDAIRPENGGEVDLPGYEHLLNFRTVAGRRTLSKDGVTYKQGEPSRRIEFVRRRDEQGAA